MTSSSGSPAPSGPAERTPEERTGRLLAGTLATWLLLATVHRLALLGRYHMDVLAGGKADTLSISDSWALKALAVLNGFATDIASYLFLVAPLLLIAWLTRRSSRAWPWTSRLPYLALGAMVLALLFNVLAWRHTDAPIGFLTLTMLGTVRSAIDFGRREAGGWVPLFGVLGAGFLLPALLGETLRRRLAAPNRRTLRAMALLAFLSVVFIFRAAFGTALPLVIRMQMMMIRDYEDPTWRMATGAAWAHFSPTLVRDLSPQELALLRPMLLPGDPEPPVDPAFPVLRKFHAAGERSPDLPRPKGPLSVVHVLMESGSAADFGCFGEPGGLTPRFDAMAAQGLLFTRFYSNSGDSEGALFSTLASAYPPSGTRDGMALSVGSLPWALAKDGYATAVVITKDTSWTAMAPILRGLEVMQIPQGEGYWGDDHAIFQKALAWIEKAPRPYYLVVFTATHHSPWRVPGEATAHEERDDWKRSRHTLAWQDRELGAFVDALEARPQADRPLLALHGDHGSHLVEGGTVKVSSMGEDALHVPLLLWRPGLVPPGRIDRLGSEVDLGPTLFDLLGLEDTEVAFLGRSLLRGGQGRVFASTIFGEGLLSLIRGDLQVVYSPYVGHSTVYQVGTNQPVEDADPARVEAMVKEALAMNRFSGWLERGRHLAPLPAVAGPAAKTE